LRESDDASASSRLSYSQEVRKSVSCIRPIPSCICEDDPANIHVYAVDVAEAETFTSVYSKSRSNLITAHEIVSLVMLRRRLEPPSFSLPDNIVILAGHKDQVRTIICALVDKMKATISPRKTRPRGSKVLSFLTLPRSTISKVETR
jgi:hypothetical protein